MKKLLPILLFFVSYCYANEFICVIQESGGDYNSISTWQPAIRCDLKHSSGTRVFNVSSKTGIINDGVEVWGQTSKSTATLCHISSTQALLKNIDYSNTAVFASGETVYSSSFTYFVISDTGNPASAVAQIAGAWTTPLTTKISITGWQTDTNNYIKIYTINQSRATGLWDTSRYRISADAPSDGVINFYEAFVWIDGLQLENTHSAADANVYGVRYYYDSSFQDNVAGELKISNCIMRYSSYTTPTSRNDYAMFLSGTTSVFKLWNNICYDFGMGIVGGSHPSTYYIYNNTVYECDRDTGASDMGDYYFANGVNYVLYLKNNIAYGTTKCYYLNYTPIVSTSNVSNDVTSPNAAFRYQKASFVDSSNKNFFLLAADTTAYAKGIDLRTDPVLPITTDIAGTLRPATPSIGACETTPVSGWKRKNLIIKFD